MEVLDGILSTNGALIATLLGALWRYFAGEKAKALEQRIRECARSAFDLARGAVDAGHVDVLELKAIAKQRAREALARLNIPLKDTVLALVDHELDVLAAELTRQYLDHQLIIARTSTAADDLASGAKQVVDEMHAAEKRGLDNPLGGGFITWEEIKTPAAGNTPPSTASGEVSASGPSDSTITKPSDVP